MSKYKKASQSVKTALRGVEFIAQHIKNADKDNEVTNNNDNDNNNCNEL